MSFLNTKTIDSKGNDERSQLAPGSYDGVIHAIIQLGVQERPDYKGQARQPENMLKILIEIIHEGESHIKGYKKMPAKIHELSGLYKFFNAAGIVKNTEELGQLLSSEEKVNSVLGKSVSVELASFEKDGKSFTYIDKVGKLDPRLPQPEAQKESFVFSFVKPDLSVFRDKLSKFTRKEISGALNVAELPKELHEVMVQDNADQPKSPLE